MGSDWKGPQCVSWSTLLAQAVSSQSTWQRTMSRWFLGISGEGHSTISLGSSITCTAELFFFIFMWSFLTSVSYTGHFYLRLNLPSSLSLSWFERCSSPLIVFITLHWTCSFVSVLRSPDPDTTLQMLLYQD